MSRGYRFAVFVTLWIFAAVIHYVGVIMFVPDGQLWTLAQSGLDAGYISSGWREQQYKIFTQYIPLLLMAFSTVWLFATEYERQTATRRVRR